jgi:hypothetical protein
MTFGEAIRSLQSGGKVQRAGWNGKGMYLYLAHFNGFDPCIVMYTATGTKQPGWLASQADILSSDWQEVQ